jgi:dTDP-4-amino-4,6-dideoxygalactose transaminase
LGIRPGNEVLVPAYSCGTEIDALQHSGARVVGYKVSRRCKIDLADLMIRKSEQTRAVYLIHYFGWEQPMEELRRWCDEQGLFLIEDCALALFSEGSNGNVGRMGDAAIFSLPKTLGFYHGGLLSMSASRTVEMPRLVPAGSSVMLQEIQHSARTAALAGLERLGLYGVFLSVRRRLRRNRRRRGAVEMMPPMPAAYYFKPELDADRGIHPWAYAVAGSVPWREIVLRRRANYSRLARALEGIPGIRLLFDQLPVGVCPLSLPLLVPNRDACIERLQAVGIAALPWWAGFHPNGIVWDEFPDACWLKRNLLTLPVHQGVDDQHSAYVVETVMQVLQSAIAESPKFNK